ncbi:MAG: aminotransferase class V-fold PLP-dependent enzyme [Candidatus Cloacimonetes bacterium]|nr:aminotransferase class V-fold PLP-dependent enzyme [Candidatus Cloacimonadota bacterium]
MQSLERYFEKFRRNVIGYGTKFTTPYGEVPLVYADWTASGRLYLPIEDKLSHEIGPFIGNTHTETTTTGTAMTLAYKHAKEFIKRHVNAGEEDIILLAGSGMTGAIVKLQRIMGLKFPEQFENQLEIAEEDNPIVFISHMEHHSNHISWLETICDVEIVRTTDNGLVDMANLISLFEQYKNRKLKIVSLTACSNVTGIQPEIGMLAKIAHSQGGLCFIDYACSAPYVKIDMHPEDEEEKLDAIFFSPHKFLGGPGSTGVLIFDSKLYHNKVPDRPGGGTVSWTSPWNEIGYLNDIEQREDGGTPPFMQTIKAALCIQLKEEMGIDNILKREEEIVSRIFARLPHIDRIHILQDNITDRMGVISFHIEDIHYNLAVKLLNDRYGIQMRGGCACAGTYGHFLFYIRKNSSKNIKAKIDKGDLSSKPGWIRFSINPVMTNSEIDYILDALQELVKNIDEWEKDYEYDAHTNEFFHKSGKRPGPALVREWFSQLTPED